MGRGELTGLLFVLSVVKQADHHAPRFQAPGGTVFAQDDWRKVPGIRVGQTAVFIVIETQEERGVLFRLRRLVDVAVEQPPTLRPRGAGHGPRHPWPPGAGVGARHLSSRALLVLP